jgi:4-hydroxy-2-oxoheptanedioate aldolase
MRPNKIRALWKDGKPAAAGWLSSGNAYIAEAMANSGYDAIIIDMQHGMGVTPDKAIACLQAISTTDTVPIVRVAWNDPKEVQFVLDAGAYGVIIPLVNTYDEAVQAAGASRYPPLGYRSLGPNRAPFYAGDDYFQHANSEIIVLVMIETVQAVDNLEEIAKAPGIDGFYIGPSDLAVSLGIPPGPGAAAEPRHAAACQRVVDVATASGLVPCHHGSGPDEAVLRFAHGFKMCQIGSDVGMVRAGAAAALKTVSEG